MNAQILKLITRQSPLALWQAEQVKSQLEKYHQNICVKIIPKKTTGDKQQTVALNQIGGKSLFVKELQAALLTQEADIAVHSVKDLAAKNLPGLKLTAVLERGDSRDAFISNKFNYLNDLPTSAIIGTASPRRQSQLLAIRPDFSIKLLRGNIATRLKKLADNEFDAIILAAAGLQRLELTTHIRSYFSHELLLPAIGQGAIGVECRADDKTTQALLAPLNHKITFACVSAERAVNARLGGNCFTPIAAHAQHHQGIIKLSARVGSLDGQKMLCANAAGKLNAAENIGLLVAEKLLEKGAEPLLTLS